MGLDDLIARLEKAAGPDREIDRAIAQTCFRNGDIEWDDGELWWGFHGEAPARVPYFTKLIDHALFLMLDGYARSVDATAPECGIRVEVHFGPNSKEYFGDHLSEPIATCIAALKARARTAQESQ